MASVAVVIVLVIVASSAYLRQSSMRINCPDWPMCAQRIAGQDAEHAPPALVGAVRLAHRLSATIAGVAVMLIFFLTLAHRPRLRADLALSTAIIVLTVFLAVLGRWSRASQGPLITLGNLLGGLTLLALLQWMRLRTSPIHAAPEDAGRLAPVAVIALALAFVAIALGALVSFDQSISTAHAASEGVFAFTHLFTGVLMLLLTGTLALHPAAGRTERRIGITAFVLAILQALTGWLSIRFGYPLPAALAHNLLAAFLLIALETTAYRCAGAARAQH